MGEVDRVVYESLVGVLWERDYEYRIVKNARLSDSFEQRARDAMCPHCHGLEQRVLEPYFDGEERRDWIFYCPRIVVARNEGGYNSTGLCLDCLLEAVKGLKEAGDAHNRTD